MTLHLHIFADAEGTVHGAYGTMRLGAAICGSPPRKASGGQWLVSDRRRPLAVPTRFGMGTVGDVTCQHCRDLLSSM